MKKVSLFFIAFFVSISLFAQIDQALLDENADKILEARAAGTAYANIDYELESGYNFDNSKGEAFARVLNFKDGGFLLLALYENMYPVLAYSFTNSCPRDDLPFGFINWIRDVGYQSEAVKNAKLVAGDRISEAWHAVLSNPDAFRSRSGEGIEPLLHTRWNQGRYYNTSCPDDPAGPDDHALTGCVATALGQLMNYFRYPQQGEGYYSYTDPTYGFLEINFSGQTYNWDAMGTELSEYNSDVADLLHHIGVSVDMQYGPNGSGMYNHKGAYTLRTYFGYSDTTRYYFRDSLDETFDWAGMLIDHLDQGIPLYYAGWSDTIFQMGHAFIADAYQDSVFFHFNWGWGGSSDGYFNLNSLTPSGSDFTLLHEAIAYATPDGTYPVYCTGQKILTNLQGCIDDGSGPLNDYTPDASCEWLIQPDDTVSFIEFELLECDLADGDELIVYDGATDEASVLASYSGQNSYESFESSSDKVLVRFVSDNSQEAGGWMLAYSSEKPDFCTVMEFVTDSAGIITDGSHSFPYHDQTYCNWFITPDGAENIRIEFTEIDIADGDFVRIMDRTNNQTIATLSGTELPGTLDIISDDVSVTFDTDNSTVAGGWALRYAMNVVSVRDHLQFESCFVHPNPASENAVISLTLQKEDDIELRILSADGKIQLYENILAHAGENQIRLDVSGLESGLYFVSLKASDKRQVLKLNIK